MGDVREKRACFLLTLGSTGGENFLQLVGHVDAEAANAMGSHLADERREPPWVREDAATP